MATNTDKQTVELQIRRTLDASCERVFEAWTDAKRMLQWFIPSDEYQTLSVEIDPRVGGRYQIRGRNPQGEIHTVGGVFQEMVKPTKIVFTWSKLGLEGGGCSPASETLVTLEFRDVGGKTELTLTHQRFPDQAARDRHNEGWTGCLNTLVKYVATTRTPGGHRPDKGRTV